MSVLEPAERLARGELAAEIRAVKDEPGPDVIAYRGASFAGALVAPGLIDKYCLAVQPVAVGTGQALFAQLTAALPSSSWHRAVSRAESWCRCAALRLSGQPYEPRATMSPLKATWSGCCTLTATAL